MMQGSCLCGGVRYQIRGGIGDIVHCHCVTCRKAHGAAFSSVAAVDRSSFEVVAGEDLIKGYRSSPDKTRYFCGTCGSQLYAHRDGQAHYVLRLGTLDDDPGVRPVNHIWVSEKAPWYDPKNDCALPQFDAWADER